MKKALLFMLLLFGFLLVACQPATIDDPDTNVDVESIQFNMDQTTLVPGEYTLVAVALPENSDQNIRFSIQGIVEGVGILGNKLTVGLTAEDGLVFTVIATSVYDPTIRQTKSFTISNEGSEAIVISTESELRAIRTVENGLNQSYVLANDIVLTEKWVPIGVAEQELDNGTIVPGEYFNGVFDGAGFSIKGISIDEEEPMFNAGFFAQIGATGIVKNVELEGSIVAQGWSGGVAGINGGTITNVISNIAVTVRGTSAGSMVSVNRGLISYSYGIGAVSSLTNPNTAGRSAGLVVANEGTMTEVYGDVEALQTPNYAAFGPSTNPKYMLSTVDMKLASTWVNFDTDVWFIANGTYPLLKHDGFIPPVIDTTPIVTIKNTDLELDLVDVESLLMDIEVINALGDEVLVYALKDEVAGVSIDQTGLVTFDKALVQASFSFTVKVLIEGTDVFAEKTFTAVYNPIIVDDVVYIDSEAELMSLLSGQTNPENLSKTFKLSNDIILTTDWTAIGLAPDEETSFAGVPFTGTFDGNGYAISGIKMLGSGYNKGFFAFIGESGIVQNTKFSGNVEANAWSGALAAVNSGLIKNVIVDMEVYVWANHGGALVEHNHGTIENVIVTGKAVSDNGPTAVGLVVTNSGTLTNVFANIDTVGTTNLTSLGAVVDDGSHIISGSMFVSASTYDAFDSTIWNVVEGVIPSLVNDTIVDHTVYISTAEQLVLLLSGQVDPANLDKSYKLTADITLVDGWVAIGLAPDEETSFAGVPFTGVFDGNGHTISGIKMLGGGWNKGFFAFIGETGVVKQTKFSGNVEANAWSGALAAVNSGLISDVIVDMEVYVWGSHGGALVEHNHGIIQNVIVTGKAVSDSGPTAVGLVVTNSGTLTNVFANIDTVGTTNFKSFGAVIDDGTYLISAVLFESGSTYAAFDTTIWNVLENGVPSLIVK